MRIFTLFILLLSSAVAIAQETTIKGLVLDNGNPVAFANIMVVGEQNIAQTNEKGEFQLRTKLPGKLLIKALGYREYSLEIKESQVEIEIDLQEHRLILDEALVTGTAGTYTRSQSPVLVDILNQTSLKNNQSCNMAEGLNYLPGLRVESNCQTCNYTQLRMNGLGGAYSQILINGRALISPLSGLYGLEQIPANMVQRIEVMRGGASSLYGSSAIGGVVNIITNKPNETSLELDMEHRQMKGASDDWLNLGGSWQSKGQKLSTAINLTKRYRTAYDRNNDDFSELPEIDLTALNASLNYKASSNDRFDLALGYLEEYRYGGELDPQSIPLALQAEERNQQLMIASILWEHQWKNQDHRSSAYGGTQITDRSHYTAVFPDDTPSIAEHLDNPPYGTSQNESVQAGITHNWKITEAAVKQILSGGIEFKEDKLLDAIPAYDYRIDQNTSMWSAFAEYDLKFRKTQVLLGARADKHSLLKHVVWSPRVAIKQELPSSYKLRVNYSAGFRAPQAFDADLHIAFAGGGISRVVIDPSLQEERSRSLSASIEKDWPAEDRIYGFTIDAFYTTLKDAFALEYLQQDEFGLVFMKTNGDGASVWGSTLQFRANFNSRIQLNGSLTVQQSQYENPIEYEPSIPASNRFLKTPDTYGFLSSAFDINDKFSLTAQLLYTGKMLLVHYSGAPEQPETSYEETPPFFDTGILFKYEISKKDNFQTTLRAGVRNLFDAFQPDPDSGKNRDSNYVYGPATPRMFTFGISVKFK